MVTNAIGIHWIPTHRDSGDKEVFSSWNPAVFKVVATSNEVPYLEDAPPNAKILIRNHPMSELYDNRSSADFVRDPAKYGEQHAAVCLEMATYCESKGIPRGRLLFEGINEPQLWAGESPVVTNAYYKAFLLGLHSISCNGVIGNFGVGWPGNGGITGAPPIWSPFEGMIAAMKPGDFLGLHEYWALGGVKENWGWWAGRYTQCPYNVPIIMTECGIDTGVMGMSYGGWRALPGTFDNKAAAYVDQLFEYAYLCLQDTRIYCVLPFTYDIGSPHWEQFNLKDSVFLRAWWKRVEKTGYPQARDTSALPVLPISVTSTPVGPVVIPSDGQTINITEVIREAIAKSLNVPYTPTYALSVKAQNAGLGIRLTDEIRVSGYVAQGHANGFVYTKEGDWEQASIQVGEYR